MSNYVVGLTGRKRSGKDTFAARLVENGFTRVSFADPLRSMALAIDPWVRIEQDEGGLFFGPGTVLTQDYHFRLSEVVASPGGWEKAKELREVRRLLQVIGTDGVRNIISDTAWIEVAVRTINAIDGPVVVTDCRFPNEAAIADTVVRVVRPSLGESGDLHPSETAMDDYIAERDVINDGTVDDLRQEADRFILDHLADIQPTLIRQLIG